MVIFQIVSDSPAVSVHCKTGNWYSGLCNRWLSLFGVSSFFYFYIFFIMKSKQNLRSFVLSYFLKSFLRVYLALSAVLKCYEIILLSFFNMKNIMRGKYNFFFLIYCDTIVSCDHYRNP